MKRNVSFPDNFFEGEIRNGFYIEKMMKKAWAAQIEVLAEVDRVCKMHGIQYYADWGTLLGAVRHHGFIPWDDDLDITMKRPDYMKFWQTAAKDLPEGYQVLNINTAQNWDRMLTKVVNGDKIRFDEQHLEKYHGCPYVVGLDIFPMDYIAPNDEEDRVQCELIRLVSAVINMVDIFERARADEMSAAEGEEVTWADIESLLKVLEDMCRFKPDQDQPLKQQLYQLEERLCSMYTEEESEALAIMPDRAGNFPHYRVPKSGYDTYIEMPFENVTIPVPADYELLLTIKYGENYMIPRLHGMNHDYPFYREQERMARRVLGTAPK